MTEAEQLAERARRALAEGREAEMLAPMATAAARARSDPALWQWTALLHRALDERDMAMAAFETAARLAPGDARIAHGRARVALEAGQASVDLFAAALRLAPSDPEVLLGRAAARLAAGEGAAAERELAEILRANPRWYTGHEQLARLRWMLGARDRLTHSLEQALAVAPRDAQLWITLLVLLGHAGRWDAVRAVAARARLVAGTAQAFDLNEAIALSELGERDAADALFNRLVRVEDEMTAVHCVRHLLRTGRIDRAMPLIEQWTRDPGHRQMWPYAAISWRLTGDARGQWLEGDASLVAVIDLAERLPPLDRVAELLRTLHRAQSQPLDQSVRGGTQTDGALFARIEPEIRAVRQVVADAVAAHVRRLPPVDARHPTLAMRRDRPVRFAGSWSVRLQEGGFHANHVHPEGWLSSALYIVVPDVAAPEGHLALGQPQAELGIELPPLRTVAPAPGRLVLFPSTMWHGTLPFSAGERMTIAFDVARPG